MARGKIGGGIISRRPTEADKLAAVLAADGRPAKREKPAHADADAPQTLAELRQRIADADALTIADFKTADEWTAHVARAGGLHALLAEVKAHLRNERTVSVATGAAYDPRDPMGAAAEAIVAHEKAADAKKRQQQLAAQARIAAHVAKHRQGRADVLAGEFAKAWNEAVRAAAEKLAEAQLLIEAGGSTLAAPPSLISVDAVIGELRRRAVAP